MMEKDINNTSSLLCSPDNQMIYRIKYLFLSAALICTAASAGQETLDPDYDLFLPGVTGALADDARALKENPATLGFMNGLILNTFHLGQGDRSMAAYYLGAGMGPLGAGFGQEWIYGSDTVSRKRTMIALAAGDRAFSLGGAVRWLEPDNSENRLVSYDLGVAGRTHPRFSWSIRAKDLGLEELTNYSAGFGYRLFRDKITVGFDRIWMKGESIMDPESLFSWGLSLEPWPGFSLSGNLLHNLVSDESGNIAFQVALGVDLANAGISVGHSPPNADTVTTYAGLRLSTSGYPTSLMSTEQVLLNLDRILSPVDSLLFSGIQKDPFLDLIRLLDQIKRDPQVNALILRTSGRAPLSYAKAEELRQSVARLQEKGKKVFFYLDGGNDVTIYLASSGDKIFASPAAGLNASGISISAAFIGEGLEKLGIKAEFAKAGIYKSSPEILERSDISEPHLESIEAILDDTWERYVSSVVESTKIMDFEEYNAIINKGIYNASVAHNKGLIDELFYPDEMSSIISENGLSGKIVNDYKGRRFSDKRWGRPPAIAVIPVTGTIIQGETPSSPFRTADATGSATVSRALQEAVDDPHVAAIVLRVDSPGGEAHASDLIWRAVKVADETKPVIVSMGSVAASGGYYVSAGARKIVANPSTITGSIGVFAGSMDLSGLFEKIGLNMVTITRGELANLFGADNTWTEKEREAVQAYVDSVYDVFLDRVATGRNMDRRDVEIAAQGRIWTGMQAYERNLVDMVGTFQDAVELAKREAGIKPDRVVDLAWFHGTGNLLSSFTGRGRPLNIGTVPESFAGHAIDEIIRTLGHFLWIKPDIPLTMMPVKIEIQ